MNKKIKLILFSTLISFFGLTAAFAAGPNDCKNPQDWRTFGGFSHQTCPDGLGYPSMNAYNDEQIFTGSYLKAFEFAMVRKTNNGNENRPNQGFANQVNLNTPDETAQFFIYTHNSGNPNCNTSDQATLNRNNCSQNTIAQNVRLKITGGLSRQEDGTIKSLPGSRHIITFEISSRNTTPRAIQDSIIINTPANKVLVLSQNSSDNRILNENNVVHSFVGGDLVNNAGIRLSSSYTGANSSIDFYGSEDYRLRILGKLSFEDAPTINPPTCKEVTLTQLSATSDARIYEIGMNPESFRSQLGYTITPNPDTTAGLARMAAPDQDVLRDFARPTVRFTSDKGQLRVQNPSQYYNISVQVGPNTLDNPCRAPLTFPATPPTDAACESLEFETAQVGTSQIKIPFRVTPRDMAENLQCTTVTSQFPITIDVNRNLFRTPTGLGTITIQGLNSPMVVCKVVEEDGSVNPACQKTYSRLTPNLPERPTIPPQETTACESFSINRTTFETGTRPSFSVTNKNPNNFNGNVIWSLNGVTVATQSINSSFTPSRNLTASDTVAVRWVNHEAGEDDCFAEAKPKPAPEEDKCEALIVKDSRGRTITTSDRLPGANSWESYTISTRPAKYVDEIDVEATNIFVTENGNTYYAFNGQTNARIEFDGPDNCNLTLTRPGGGNEVEVEKRIRGNNTQRNFRPDYDFADVGKPVEYRVSLKTERALPSRAETILDDDIFAPNGIPGKNREVSNQNFGTLRQHQTAKPQNNTWNYTGLVRWDSRSQDCAKFTKDCSVQYRNQARVIIEFPGEPLTNRPNGNRLIVQSNPTYAIVLCPFILSRGFGDVYLESGLNTGVNVAACGARNTQSPVFTPAPEKPQQIVSTGGQNQPSHAICKDANAQNLPAQLREIFSPETLRNFSSSVCQVAINNSERWQRSEIEKNLVANFARLTPVSQRSATKNLNSIADKPENNSSRIASFAGLTLSNGESPVSIQGNSARTIVVYGDLNINSNLQYEANSSGTVAFVVIGGDIVVAPEVTKLEGIFVTIKNQNKGGSFKWSGEGTSKTPIEIKGSAYGNIQPLFDGVEASGSLLTDRGGVTVVFDGRITRKIPPGLQDVIKFNQFQTATQSSYFTSVE